MAGATAGAAIVGRTRVGIVTPDPQRAEHGIRFITDPAAAGAALLTGGYHTYGTWGLVPTSRPAVQPPKDETPTVKIPGAREIPERRLTEATGGPVFGMRTGSWEFRVKARRRWAIVYSRVLNALQGREVRAILDDDRAHYYVGTVNVSKWASDPARSVITLEYSLRPYKYEITSSIEDWLWSPFSFIDGVIRQYGELQVTASRTLTVIGSPMPAAPRIKADAAGMTLTYNGTTYPLTKDVWFTDPALTLGDGEHTFVFTGTGKISIDYRGGKL